MDIAVSTRNLIQDIISATLMASNAGGRWFLVLPDAQGSLLQEEINEWPSQTPLTPSELESHFQWFHYLPDCEGNLYISKINEQPSQSPEPLFNPIEVERQPGWIVEWLVRITDPDIFDAFLAHARRVYFKRREGHYDQ